MLTLSRQVLRKNTTAAATSILRNMSSTKLKGKVAIVTAATDGIGFAIARRLGQDGASVVVSSRKQANVDRSVKTLKEEGLDVDGIVCHVGKAEDRKNLVEFAVKKKGGVDIFVSNAAANPAMGPMLECTESVWDKIFEINVKCGFLLTQLVAPEMEKRGGGSIVFISSIGGYQPLPLIGAYSVSKTALFGLTQALAKECAASNIRVNCVSPGIIETKFSEPLTSIPAAKEVLQSNVIMGRLGKPHEIASVVSFICSEDASFITGETVSVTGGYYSRL